MRSKPKSVAGKHTDDIARARALLEKVARKVFGKTSPRAEKILQPNTQTKTKSKGTQ
jgi:hypothetical protein